ncbi:hypothetical protein [Phycicoccus sp. Soil748]|uniref:hypothetical protein n=1 Tax=Phycicoccus sp. Soil748 TaxID=1736397 RepID=UPI000702D837|nr:hypothetical protein [Phycicoccus sp. Soil748]KRE57220.1 hypothetical protein ASG70_02050 [Phycicoccus sp. Soil748]
MPTLATRILLAALTAIGLVLLVVGSWFTVHLGPSGSATFTTTPPRGSVVVLEPSVLNRVDRPTTVTATTRDGAPVFIGRATPSDAKAVVGGADVTSVTGARVRSWSLERSRSGAGAAPALAGADVWRSTATGKGSARIQVRQADAPEAVVIATAEGRAADLVLVRVTVERRTWFFQALLVSLVGLLATAAGAAGLWQQRRHALTGRKAVTGPDHTRPTEEVSS